MKKSIIHRLQELRDKEIISTVEIEFVRFLLQLYPDTPEAVQWAAAACINAQQRGHVCLNIAELDGFIFDDAESGLRITEKLKQEWLRHLKQCEWISSGEKISPLVLEQERLYLHRFWKYEEELAAWLTQKSARNLKLTEGQREIIQQLVPPASQLFEVNWQHVALCLSFLKDLVVISGGPGTGKTYTVLNIIAAHALASGQPLRMALAAPTGKASRRLVESVEAGKENLPKAFREKLNLPDEAFTVHKLLGAGYRGNNFKYNEQNKLPYDLVVVDEASMLDITMWVRLVRALAEGTKLVVLGDKDQLASVEAGSILGDICGGENSFSPGVVQAVAETTGMQVPAVKELPAINDTVVFLTKSYRFGEDSGIGKFAQAVNEMNADEAIKLLGNGQYSDLQWRSLSTKTMQDLVQSYTVEHYQSYTEKPGKRQLAASNQKKILCALRRGVYGVEQINKVSEKQIKQKNGWVLSQEWYPGRIIMSTRNDRILKIRNGELGIYLATEASGIAFEGEQALKVSPARLNAYEAAYAITIHKSQGSEFDDVAIVLPREMSPLLSKEILYTAVTRARRNTLIIGDEDIIRAAIQRPVERHSGLKEKIWNR